MRPLTRPALLLAWTLTRLVTLALLLVTEGNLGVTRDVDHFAANLHRASHVGLAHTLVEYPLLAVAVVAVPWLLAGGGALYPLVLVGCALVTDGAFTALLGSRRTPGRQPALVVWLLAAPLLGGLFLVRFDLLAGILVACAVLVLAERPRLASVATALATGIKLWPVLLVPALVAATRRRSALLGVYVLTGVALAGGSVALAGWGRLVSPLRYQSGRGLQIESLAASPAMLGWLLRPRAFDVHYSRFKAYEVTGPGVGTLLALSSALTVLVLAALAVLWLRALRHREPLPADVLGWLVLASVSGYLVASKVFSPQYLLWLLPVVAAGLVLAPTSALRRWAAVLLVVATVSHLVYPWLYHGLLEHRGRTAAAVLLLVLRNVLVLALAAEAGRRSWQLTASRPGA